MCRGYGAMCLDCEFQEEETRRKEYARGVQAGAEDTMANVREPTGPTGPTGSAYQDGYARGVREARNRVRAYRRVLDEFEVAQGRRVAAVYCIAYLKRGKSALVDWNLVRELQTWFTATTVTAAQTSRGRSPTTGTVDWRTRPRPNGR